MKPAAPGGAEQVLVRNSQYEIATVRIGAFLVVRIRGRYVDELLTELRSLFREKTSFAVDISALSGISMPLAREILFTAQILKNTDHRLVLLNPTDRLRSLLSLISTDSPVTVLLSESQLTQNALESESRAQTSAQEVDRVRNELRSNRLWQFIDVDGCWLCPYCAHLLEDLRILSRVSISLSVAEQVYRHLHFQCPSYDPGKPGGKTVAELEVLIKKANQDRVKLSKQQMTEMESRISELQGKARRAEAFEQSVRIASARQKRLLPAKPPDLPGAEMGIVYRPAEQLSGDFYDFVPFPDGRMGFIIGDVSGHGIEAGILMGMAKKVLSLRLEECGRPDTTLLQANRDLFRELDRQTFVTAFVAVFDPSHRTLITARAGHNPPLLFNPARDPHILKIEDGGLGLGMSTGEVFERTLTTQSISIQRDDVLLLYTDGLVEARNQAGDEFGIERIVASLEETVGRPTTFILGVLSYELDRFSTGLAQEDDVSAVLVRFKQP